MKPVPHGEPYAGKLHVRFDEGYPPKNGEALLRVAEGRAGVPDNKGRPALLYTLFDMVWLRLKGWMNGGWEMRGRLERDYSPFGFFGCKMKRAVRLLTRGSFFSQRPVRK